MIFEWDEHKRRENLRKHGFDFADGATFFQGPVVTEPDERFHYGEMRLRSHGLLHRRVLVVIHTAENDVERLISMRRATRHEEARYFETLKAEIRNLEGFEN